MNRAIVATLWIVIGGTGLMAENAAAEAWFVAIRSGGTSALKILARGSNPKVRDSRGMTPLMYAAAYGTAAQVRLLLEAGADVNARNDFRGTALLCAGGDPSKSRLLIEAGADVNVASAAGRTPLMLAARHRDGLTLVRLLLDKGADARALDSGHNTALLEAAFKGNTAIMRLLIEAGADVNVSTTASGMSPLGAAISSYQLPAVALLLTSGAKADRVAMDDHGQVRNGRLALGGLTALMLAAPYGSPSLIKSLLDAGALINDRDVRGMTALILSVAAETQDPEVVGLLLKAGADVSARTETGETALDWANKFGDPKVLAILRQAGPRGRQWPPAGEARPAGAAAAMPALEKSIALLQRSSTDFFRNSGCVGCHHQPLTAMAVSAARRAGVRVDEVAFQDQLRTMESRAAAFQVHILQGMDPALDTDLALISGLSDSGYAASPVTDAAIIQLAAVQQPDGSWHRGPALSRTPLEDSDIYRTAQAVRALRVYRFPAAKRQLDTQIARAREWLMSAKPRTTDEYATLLFGLKWTETGSPETRRAAEKLIARQRPDGGWAGNANLPSDAFATGEALCTLRISGAVHPANPIYESGVRYLLNKQYSDGSWHVRSRAVPFQPYFESGFPFEHDQWISAAATAWASAAISAGTARRGQNGW